MSFCLVLVVLLGAARWVRGIDCGADYPKGCKCLLDSHQFVRSVNCTGLGLTQFPDIDTTVRTLDLSGNSIKHLRKPKNEETFNDLITLLLNNCGIEDIEGDFFSQFPSLNIINLQHNKLKQIPSIPSSSNVLELSHNLIASINQFNSTNLRTLYLDHNELSEIHENDLNDLSSLAVLTMKSNSISEVHPNSLAGSITHLSLGRNKLTSVPALSRLRFSLLSLTLEHNQIATFDNILFYQHLQNCTLFSNKIKHFPANVDRLESSVTNLFLTQNEIETISKDDFYAFPLLQTLDLSENELEYIPDKCFSHLKLLNRLELNLNRILEMSYTSLKHVTQLTTYSMRYNKLKLFSPPLKNHYNLNLLDLTGNKLSLVPTVPSSLYLLYLSGNQITQLTRKAFRNASYLRDLDVSYNAIEEIDVEVFPAMPQLEKLYLEGNNISRTLEGIDLSSSTQLAYLDIGANGLQHIPASFFDKTAIHTLNMANNKLTAISNTTLEGLDGILTDLDLSFNDLAEMSHVGLSAVQSLKLDGNERLEKLPRQGLTALKQVTVPFPVMCCWFKKIKKNSLALEAEASDISEIRGYWGDDRPIDSKATLITSVPETGNYKGLPYSTPWRSSPSEMLTLKYVPGETYKYVPGHGVPFKFATDATYSTYTTYTTTPYTFTTTATLAATTADPGRKRRDLQTSTHYTTLPYTSGQVSQIEEISFDELLDMVGTNATVKTIVPISDRAELKCSPQPDEFNPCEDLIGNWVLRIGVWAVCSLAVVGNLTLFFVTLLSTKKMTPTRFLIVNLSFSDLFTGVYLMILAVVDARTYGYYEDYARDWQNGAGCKVAGFMVTFSSELSVFTLTIISVERMVTILQFSNPHKHLKTRHIAVAMLFGWMISVTAGALPLLGFSDYSLVAICLPFQKNSVQDFGLIMSLMVINTVAVCIIIYCYLTIFCNVRHLQKPLDNADFRETLRMALIILTDVLCWLPIVICGVSAAFGNSLITTSNAKILVVFFLPLNACANPFLYSLSRPGFKKDILFVLNKMGMFQQAYYITSRRKSGMDLEIKKKLADLKDLKEIRKASADSTSSSGYSSDTSIPKKRQFFSLLRSSLKSEKPVVEAVET